MVEVDESKIIEAENAIRDLINWIEVLNQEEIEGSTKQIEDSAVEELKTKLEELAKKVSGMKTTV